MIVLSLDCGNKSLGVCILKINPGFIKRIKKSIQKYKEIKPDITPYIEILWVGSYNLIPDLNLKDANIIIRTQRLKAALQDICSKVDNKIDHVLIEYQMVHNKKTNDQSAQIVMYFSEMNYNFTINEKAVAPVETKESKYPEIHIVLPTLKNTIVYKGIKHHTYVTKYAKLEDANKAHCKEIFKAWCIDYELDYAKKCKATVLRDLADSFCQGFIWSMYYGMKNELL